MKTSKTRHQFYLPDALSEKLEALAAKPGTSKTAILTDALNAWFERKGAHELDQRFGPRLDRLGRSIVTIDSRIDMLAETLSAFILYEMHVNAHAVIGDDETVRIARSHHAQFVNEVGRRLAHRKS